jgi:hypothetical protein
VPKLVWVTYDDMPAGYTGPSAPHIDRVLFEQDGVVTHAQLRGFLSNEAIRNRLNSGRWQSAARGIYVTHNGPLTYRQRRWVAVFAASRNSRYPLGGLTALESHGLRGQTSWTVHILVPAHVNPNALPAGVVAHRTTLFLPDHVLTGTPPRTTPARSLVDGAAWSKTDDDARALIASAFQQRIVTIEEVSAAIGLMRRSHRRALVLETALDATGGSHSISELDFVKLCRDHRLPMPSRQVPRTDADGRLRYLDAEFDDYNIVVEIDGSHHMDPRLWWEDMRRQNDVWIAGQTILRFPAWVIRAEPEQVADQIRRAMRAARNAEPPRRTP